MRQRFWTGLLGLLVTVLLSVTLHTPVRAQTVTVLAFGDSLTAGYGLPRRDGFVPQMQAWLDQAGEDAVIVNAGVSGNTTRNGLARADRLLTADIDAMILALGGNDYLRGINPAVTRNNLDQILTLAAERDVPVLLVGIRAGDLHGPRYQTAFNDMYRGLASEYRVQMVPTFYQGLLDAAGTQDRVRSYLQRDALHPNAEGVREIVDFLGPKVRALITSAR